MASHENLPIFPLASVLFPGGTLALKIFEPRYMDMAKASLKNRTPFGIALIREGQEVGAPADPHAVGTLATITDWDMENLGVLQVKIKGGERFCILDKTITPSGLVVANVSELGTDTCSDQHELVPCAAFLRRVLAQIGMTSGVTEGQYTDASWVSFRLTELLPFNNIVKQKMLELTDANMRLDVLHRFLHEQNLLAA